MVSNATIRVRKLAAVASIGALAAGFSHVAVAQTAASVLPNIQNSESDTKDLKIFDGVIDYTQKNYLLPERLEALKDQIVQARENIRLKAVPLDKALHEILSALDPHSRFKSPTKADDNTLFMRIGADLSESGPLAVLGVYNDTPADLEDIRVGDVILRIQGVSVDTMDRKKAIKSVCDQNTRIADIVLSRDGELLHKKIPCVAFYNELVRAHVLSNNVAYVQIKSFLPGVWHQFKRAVERVQRQTGDRVTAYVLDLRDNPGGYVESAVAIADEMLDGYQIVTTIRKKDLSVLYTHKATPGDMLKGAQLVVLVNADTTSAAELLADALQANHRATIVGTRTYGKGLVQDAPSVGNYDFAITTKYYFSANGRSLHNKGVTTDIEVRESRNQVIYGAQERNLPKGIDNPQGSELTDEEKARKSVCLADAKGLKTFSKTDYTKGDGKTDAVLLCALKFLEGSYVDARLPRASYGLTP